MLAVKKGKFPPLQILLKNVPCLKRGALFETDCKCRKFSNPRKGSLKINAIDDGILLFEPIGLQRERLRGVLDQTYCPLFSTPTNLREAGF